jgi:6-phosphogluconate dehydrogenase
MERTTGIMSLGLIGLGSIGGNLALNIQKSQELNVCNRSPEKVKVIVKKSQRVKGYENVEEMVSDMKEPRTIITALPHGETTDTMVKKLSSVMSGGDTIVDCSNEFYRTSRNRGAFCQSKGIGYLGTGLSGGAEGARLGPALMIGGPQKTFEEHEDLFKSFAKSYAYMGEDYGVGHFTKMVHNGVEYGMLQGIADVYAYCNQDGYYMGQVLKRLENTDIYGYLTKSAMDVLHEYDLNKIADIGHMNNTGLWCSEIGLEYGIPTPTINSAVNSRFTSRNIKAINSTDHKNCAIDFGIAVDSLRFVFATSLLEGYDLMQTRHVCDESIKQAWSSGTIIECPMIGGDYRTIIEETAESARVMMMYCTAAGISCPAIQAALTQYDFTHQTSTSMKFIMAQRNYFGQHEIMEA